MNNEMSQSNEANRIARQLFEFVASLQDMTREELLKYTLDMTILQSASELKKRLQMQLDGLAHLESGHPLREFDAKAQGECASEEPPVRVSIGPGARLYLQTLSRLTRKGHAEIVQDALAQFIKSQADVLRKNCEECLDYIGQLESRTTRLDSDNADL